MTCECEQLPKIFNIENYPNHLKERVEIIDKKFEGWEKLARCKNCGQFWQIDRWDKYQTICAIKIFEPENWKNFDDVTDRMQLLINNCGGLSKVKCIKSDCKNNALKSLAYCPVHAFEIGLRE